MIKNSNDNSLISGGYICGIDLLRIVSMLMVCVLHTLGPGGVLDAEFTLRGGYWAAWLLEIACFCSVNCYALISGYVGIKAKYKYSNIINLWLTVVFYSLGITLICRFTNPSAVTVSQIVMSVFPVTGGLYWYFTAYFLMFLFLPLINKGILSMSEREHRNLAIVLLLVFSCYNTFASLRVTPLTFLNNGYSVWWILILYVVGAYLRRCGDRIFSRHAAGKWLAVYACSVIFTLLVKYAMNRTGHLVHADFLVTYVSPTIVLSGIALVMLFSGLTIGNIGKKIIKFLAPLSFSVYIIHTNGFIGMFFITGTFAALASYSPFLIPFAVLGAAMCIYCACTAIDVVRFYLFKALRVRALGVRLERVLQRVFHAAIGFFLPGLATNPQESDAEPSVAVSSK